MKSLCIVLSIFTLASSILATEAIDATTGKAEPVNSRLDGQTLNFMVDWAVVCTMALGDGSLSHDLMDLSDLDPEAANFVAELWSAKANIESAVHRKELTEAYAHKYSQRKDDSDTARNAIHKELADKTSVLRQVCYFDNAERIRGMINLRLKMARSGESTTLKAAK